MELLAIVKAFIAVAAIGTVTTTLGPNEPPAERERVAIVSERTGEVLYYNYVVE